MRRALVTLCILLAACSSAEPPASTTTSRPPPTAPTTTSTVAPTSTSTTSTSSATSSTTTTPPTTVATTSTPATQVTAPGTYDEAQLSVRLGFRSDVADVTSEELQVAALAILNSPTGWTRSGFEFVADANSQLIVILAEGPDVDELCLPLDTGGTVNCQNGPVVALNADRWRSAFAGWDATLADYRTYVVNHEVGHLIGLRHPTERCPTAERISALMEPQTTNLRGCVGNGMPLDWEVDWANNRPVVIGPDPDWDGPRPDWPSEAGE
ncbi:MAG: DUF3152 domain-containing protein [bacterium]|nr:DUF3152 domain-containing protein [bacterium]